MSFRDNLLHLRQEHNMTQEQLAMLVGVSRQAVTKWEADKSYPEMDKLMKMCDLFSCTLDELVKGDLTQRVAEPGNVMPNVSLTEDVCGYDEHRRNFARKIALGVGIIMLGCSAAPLSSFYPQAIFILFVSIGASLFFILPAAFSHSAFKREHPFIVDFYTSKQRQHIQRLFAYELAAGIAVILLSVSIVAVCDNAELSIGPDGTYVGSDNPLIAALMLVGFAIGVGIIVHAALLGSRTNIERYNLNALSDLDRDDVIELVGEDRATKVLPKLTTGHQIGAVCAVIMLLSTIVAFGLLFLAPFGVGSLTLFWLPWAFGGILCGVAAVILRTLSNQK